MRNLIKSTNIITVSYPQFPNFKLDLSPISRESINLLLQKSTKQILKDHIVEDILDIDVFSKLYIEKVIKGWKGLTLQYVANLIPIEYYKDDYVKFSVENAYTLYKYSSSFDIWLSETMNKITKLQQEQLKEEERLILSYIRNSDVGMTKEKFLDMISQLGEDITKMDKEKIPPDTSDFTQDTIAVFEIDNKLRSMWDSMSGSYMGKDLSNLPMLLDIYEIKDSDTKLVYIYLLNIIINENIRIIGNKLKAEQRKAKK